MASMGPLAATRTRNLLGDALCAAIVVVTTLAFGPERPGPPPPGAPVMEVTHLVPTVLAWGSIVLIPFRRRWSLAVTLIALGLYVVTVVLGEPSAGVGIVAIVSAYSLGSTTSRRTTLIVGGLAAGLLTILAFTVAEFGVIDARVFQIAAGIAVAATLGDSTRSHRELTRFATERAERAELAQEAEAERRVTEERLRIAQELHDTVAHQIALINLNAGVASRSLEKQPEKAHSALSNIRASARGVLSEISDLLRYLRTDSGQAEPLMPQRGLDDIDELVAQLADAGLAVDVRRRGDASRVPTTVASVVYRIAQEGLTNAQRHGADHTAELEIEIDAESLHIVVSNPLRSASAPPRLSPSGGFGLTGIRERVASVGGIVSAGPEGDRFIVRATVPIRPTAEESS